MRCSGTPNASASASAARRWPYPMSIAATTGRLLASSSTEPRLLLPVPWTVKGLPVPRASAQLPVGHGHTGPPSPESLLDRRRRAAVRRAPAAQPEGVLGAGRLPRAFRAALAAGPRPRSRAVGVPGQRIALASEHRQADRPHGGAHP